MKTSRFGLRPLEPVVGLSAVITLLTTGSFFAKVGDMAGYIKTYREIFDHNLFNGEPFSKREAWIHLLAIAHWQDGIKRVRGNKIVVKRGEVSWSTRKLADHWLWSRGKVLRFLQELEHENMLIPEKSQLSTRYLIVNYEKYQGNDTVPQTVPQNVPKTVPQKFPVSVEDITTNPVKAKADGTTDSTTEKSTNGTKEKKYKKLKKEPIKNIYGSEFKNVKLTDEEYAKLKERFNGTLNRQIDRLDIYIEQVGDKYKSHYATILKWSNKDKEEAGRDRDRRPTPKRFN